MDPRKFLDSKDVEEYNRLAKDMEDHLKGKKYSSEAESEGYIFSIGFYPETARYAFKEWKRMKEETVYIVNYPKTGNHWLYEITRYLLYMDNEEQMKIAKGIPPCLSYLDFSDNSKKFELLDQIPQDKHLFRTHIPEALFDMNKAKKMKGKIIYILRNPKDQAVSIYHFTLSPIFKYSGYPKDWSEFFNEYMQGKQHFWTKEGETYLDHVLDWWKHKDNENVLFVYFEDMKRDIRREIRRISTFLDVEVNDEKIEKVISLTTIKAMREKMGKSESMMTRKGAVGGWKDLFTVAQSEMMDKLVAKKLAGTGIEFTYQL